MKHSAHFQRRRGLGGSSSTIARIQLAILLALFCLFAPSSVESQSCCGGDSPAAAPCGENKIRVFYKITANAGCYPAANQAAMTMHLDVEEVDEYSAPVTNLRHKALLPGICESTNGNDEASEGLPASGTTRLSPPSNGTEPLPSFCIERGHFAKITITAPGSPDQKFHVEFRPEGCGVGGNLILDGPATVPHHSFEGLNAASPGSGEVDVGSVRLRLSAGGGSSIFFERDTLASPISAAELRCSFEVGAPPISITTTDADTNQQVVRTTAVTAPTAPYGERIVDTVNGVRMLRQLLSRDNFSHVRIIPTGFEIRCYRYPGVKQPDGLYSLLDPPRAIWRVERPANVPNQVLVTETHGTVVTLHTFYYTPAAGATPPLWELRKGSSPRLESKTTFGDPAGNIITLRQIRDASNPAAPKVVTREVEVRDNQSRLIRTVRGDFDSYYKPLPNSEWTEYGYSADLLTSMRRSDGYYEFYQTTRGLKAYAPEPPPPADKFTWVTITTFSPLASLNSFSAGKSGNNRVVDTIVDDKGGETITDVKNGFPLGQTATATLQPGGSVTGTATTRTPRGGTPAVSQDLSYASAVSSPARGMPYYSLAEDGTETTTTYAAGTYDPATFAFTPSLNGSATRTEVSRSVPLAPGTREITVTDESGNSLVEETHRLTLGAASDATLLTRRISLYTPAGHLSEIRVQAAQAWRTTYEATWDDSTGHKLSERDETGVNTVFSDFDTDRRPHTITRSAIPAVNGLPAVPAQVRQVVFDVEGRLVSETTSAAGAPARVHLWTYDTAGRLSSETTSGGATEYIYTSVSYTNLSSKVGRSVVKRSSTGAVETTQYNLDGTVASVSAGLNPVEQSWTYASGAAGGATGVLEKHTQGSGANQRVITQTLRNYLGQVLQEGEYLAGALARSKTYGYSAIGQLTSISDSAVPAPANPIMTSNGATTTLRCGGNEPGNEPDRITTEITGYVLDDGAWWLRSQNSQTGSVWQNVTALSATQLSVTKRVNLAGLAELSTTTVDRNTATVTTTVVAPGIANPRVTIIRAGMVQSIKEPALTSPTIITCNGFGQEVSRVDPRTPNIAITTTYDAVWGAPETLTRGTDVTVCTYYPAGLNGKSGQLATRMVNGLVTRYDYDTYGRLIHTWGATYPLRYEYDAAGRLSRLHTFRLGSNWFGTSWPGSTGATPIAGEAVTSFIYFDGSSRLWKKQYPDGTFTEYLYSDLKSYRYWARSIGSSRLLTTYTSNYQDELIGIAYSDNTTPPVQYRHDASGRLSHVSDAAGEHDFTYAYDGFGNLTSTETVAANATNIGATTFTHTFDPLGRPTGYTFTDSIQPAAPIAVTYTYDPASGQFTAVKRGATTIGAYTYNAQTGWMEVMGNITRFPDDQGRVQKIIRTGDNPLSPTFLVKYDFDSAGRRSRLTREDGSYWQYGYNGRSEVTSGIKHYADGTEIPGFRFTYDYDAIGNRLQSTAGPIGSTPVSYTPNDLNQYESRTIPGRADVRGQATTPTGYTLYVNEHPVTPDSHGHFYYAQPVNNTTAPRYLKNSVIALKTTPIPPDARVENSAVYVGKTPLASAAANAETGAPANPLYDEDGNTIRDERWTYTWDAENRLVALDTLPEAVQAGTPDLHLSYRYDSLNRRISSTANRRPLPSSPAGVSGAAEVQKATFVYNGWNVFAEYTNDTPDVPVSPIRRTAVNYWGISSTGPAGLATLIGRDFHVLGAPPRACTPLSDENGNILRWLSSADETFEYGPFGEELQSPKRPVGDYPLRFSTNYTDDDSGLVYFGRRHYQPGIGRWLSRDPIGVYGGFNIHGMVDNNPVQHTDAFGLAPNTIETTRCTITLFIGHALEANTFENSARSVVKGPGACIKAGIVACPGNASWGPDSAWNQPWQHDTHTVNRTEAYPEAAIPDFIDPGATQDQFTGSSNPSDNTPVNNAGFNPVQGVLPSAYQSSNEAFGFARLLRHNWDAIKREAKAMHCGDCGTCCCPNGITALVQFGTNRQWIDNVLTRVRTSSTYQQKYKVPNEDISWIRNGYRELVKCR